MAEWARKVTPDPARVETLSGLLDQDPAAGHADLRAALEDCRLRLADHASPADLDDCAAFIARIRERATALRPDALEPRKGLAGLFDSRGARLKRLRDGFAQARAALAEISDGLLERLGRLAERHGALESLWIDSGAALDDAAAHWAALTRRRDAAHDGDDASSWRAETARLEDEGRSALRRPALIRALQNADAGLKTPLTAAAAALEEWTAEWTRALGLDRKRPRRVRPDPAALDRQTLRLTDALDEAERVLKQARDRRGEILDRLA